MSSDSDQPGRAERLAVTMIMILVTGVAAWASTGPRPVD